MFSTPPASKVHCSINGLENLSSTEYSKVQHLFGIAVGLFPAGGGLFFCYSRTWKKSYSDRKKSYSNRKKSSSDQKSPPPTHKKSYSDQKSFLDKKEICFANCPRNTCIRKQEIQCAKFFIRAYFFENTSEIRAIFKQKYE